MAQKSVKYSKDKRLYWIWLSLICGAASRRAVKMLRCFGTAKNIFDADEKALCESGTMKKTDGVYAEIMRHDLSEPEDILRWCDSNGVHVYTPESREYPANLLSLRDCPLVLYVIGRLPDFERECAIAAVGTRKMTEYGKRRSWALGRGLAKGGAVVVSGLALGVDGMVMASAVDAGGVSVGVLGCGVDIVYPKEHASLFKSVIKNGAIVSEYAPGTSPTRRSFPQRNRIISALAQGTVVIEADIDSGALITARCAVYQGKDLFAVPGSVDSFGAEGTNQLIKEGAFAVTRAEDILGRYEYIYPHSIDVGASHRAEFVDVGESSADEVARKYGVKTEFDRHNIYSRTDERRRAKVGARRSDAELYGESGLPSKSSAASEPPQTDSPAEIPKLYKKQETSRDNQKKRGGKNSGGANMFEKAFSEPARIDFELLGEKEKAVYGAMPADTPVLPEEIKVDGYKIQDIMSALTVLEISGAVEAGAGGYFMRTSADGAQFENDNSEVLD